jgi:Rrf2 family protein
MRVTTWTEYSLIISIHLAKRGRTGSGPVAARELADIERLPADYVEQILLRLRRAGLVQSVRGAKGGYFLARPPDAIVMAASEHQTFEINCETHPVEAGRCSPGSTCSIRPVWQALQQRVDQLLAGITLADLMRQETEVQELVGISSAS